MSCWNFSNMDLHSSLFMIFGIAGICVCPKTSANTLSPIIFTHDDGQTESKQQAIGADVQVQIIARAPHGVPRWTFIWLLDDGYTNVTLGTTQISTALNLDLTVGEVNTFTDRISISNTPSTLTTSADEFKSVVTFSDLSTADSGIKFWFVSTGLPIKSSPQLKVTNCLPQQDNVTIFNTTSNCSFGCVGYYNCPRGFVAKDQYPVMCTEDAMWNLTNETCTRACMFRQGNALISPSELVCGYNCLGYYTCNHGFSSLNTERVICSKDGTWNLTSANCIADIPNITASDAPPRNRKINAVGYEGISVHAEINRTTVNSCAWKYDGDLNDYTFYSGGTCARGYTVGVTETILCYTDGNMLETNLTFTVPLEFGKIDVAFLCDNKTMVEISLHIIYCHPTQGGVAIARPTEKCSFGCTGTYTCPPGYVPSSNNIVVCSKDATWNLTSESCVKDLIKRYQVIPRDEIVYSAGFPGLVIEVDVANILLNNCTWIYGRQRVHAEFLREGQCQQEALTGLSETVTCSIREGLVTSQLMFSQGLEPGALLIMLQCNSYILFRRTISVEYCPQNQALSAITTLVTACGYRCSGTYQCRSDLLPYRTNKVVCSDDATWNLTRNDCVSEEVSLFSENGGNKVEAKGNGFFCLCIIIATINAR